MSDKRLFAMHTVRYDNIVEAESEEEAIDLFRQFVFEGDWDDWIDFQEVRKTGHLPHGQVDAWIDAVPIGGEKPARNHFSYDVGFGEVILHLMYDDLQMIQKIRDNHGVFRDLARDGHKIKGPWVGATVSGVSTKLQHTVNDKGHLEYRDPDDNVVLIRTPGVIYQAALKSNA